MPDDTNCDDLADRDAGQHLLGLVVGDEPPLTFRGADLTEAGSRRRRQRSWAVAGAAAAAVAGVTALATLAATTGPPSQPLSSVSPVTPTGATPRSDGSADVLSPRQEAQLVEQNDVAFEQAYTPPPGWRIVRRERFASSFGFIDNDTVWDGATIITDSGGHLVTVQVVLSAAGPGSTMDICNVDRTPRSPGLFVLTIPRPAVAVCRLRGDITISVSATPGEPGTGITLPSEAPRPGSSSVPLPPQPETVQSLIELASSRLFTWPR